MKYHLIFTLDYELFGNGSGCIDKCLIDPTAKCQSLLEQAGAPLTVFVETLELANFAALEREPIRSQNHGIAAQLKLLLENGHKLELHLHPQWMSAQKKDTGWQLDYEKWRIGDLSDTEITECVNRGLSFLSRFKTQENMTSPVFRAGGWAMQPSDKVLKELYQAGIRIDSTVAPGAYNPSKGDWYDFRRTPSLPFWRISDNICQQNEHGGMIEVPIATEHIGRKAHLQALREYKSGQEFPPGCAGSYAGPNSILQGLKGKFAKLANVGTAMLDFSTLPSWALIDLTERYMSRFVGFENTIPIVAIGHNKNFSRQSEENLTGYLDWANNCPDLTYSTYETWLKTTTIDI